MRTTAPRAVRALFIAIAALLAAPACRFSYAGGGKPVNPSELDSGWLRAAPTPVVMQRQLADCGLAALAMIGGAWGRNWTVDELAREAPPSKNGVKLGKLRDVAVAHGLEAYAISGKPKDLETELRNRRPVLVGLIRPLERDRASTHYEVVVALDPRDGSVVTLDPETGKHLRRTRAVLEAEWKPVGYPTLVVVGDRATAAR
jgi:ABC-type bacteriocin/lantibiotic exporter with double-glycine peptidase domain